MLDLDEEDDEEEGANMMNKYKGKACIVKTSTRQTVLLPVPGLVDEADLTPGDLVGTNKDSYLILEKLPVEYDSRVKVWLL